MTAIRLRTIPNVKLVEYRRQYGLPTTAKIVGIPNESGEPPRNRTENPQIKSLLLCQLS